MTRNIRTLGNEELFEPMDAHLALSPELLACDGELPEYLVRTRHRQLRAHLQTLCSRLGVGLVEENEVYDEWERRGKPGAGLFFAATCAEWPYASTQAS